MFHEFCENDHATLSIDDGKILIEDVSEIWRTEGGMTEIETHDGEKFSLSSMRSFRLLADL